MLMLFNILGFTSNIKAWTETSIQYVLAFPWELDIISIALGWVLLPGLLLGFAQVFDVLYEPAE